MVTRRKRAGEGERATRVVTVRLTEAEFLALQREAEGHITISDLIRSSIQGGAPREPVLLKQVAALATLGTQLRELADRPGLPRVMVMALLDRIGNTIDALAPKTGR